ncbi:MAG TPA: MFS transporter [Chitinophagaceae bacterium]|nr:MFS transporter [Chitinophagaceae bacterium]
MPTKNDPYAALRFPEFRTYLITRFSSVFALNMQSTVVGWKIYEITRDPLSLGLIGLAELIPALTLAMPGGHIVDRREKRNMLLACRTGYLLCALSYLFITGTFATNHYSTRLIVGILYATTFAGGIIRAFNGPASFSLLSLVIPRELYPNGTTWSSSAWQTGAVLGPLLGGLLYGWIGISFTFATVFFFHLLAAVSLLVISPKPVHYLAGPKDKLWTGLTEGLRFVFRTRALLAALSLDLFAVLFGGAVALLPIYADLILHVGAKGLGILRAAPAVGSCLTLFLLAYIPLKKLPGMKLLLAVLGFGISTILFGLSRNFLFSLAALFFTGMFDGVSVVIRNTILQTKTPDHMRGRVSDVHTMFVGSSNEFGSFESGVTAKWMGTVPAVVFGGCMTIGVVITTYIISPALRKLRFK